MPPDFHSDPADRAPEAGYRVETVSRIATHRPCYDLVQFGRAIAKDAGQSWDWIFEDGTTDFGNGSATRELKDRAAGEEFEENSAYGIDIDAFPTSEIAISSQVLFWRRVHGRARKSTGFIACYDAREPRDSEVNDYRSAVRLDQNVPWFQIAVDDFPLVRAVHGRTHLSYELEPRCPVMKGRCSPRVQRQPLHEFHGIKGDCRAAGLGMEPGIENPDDPGVIQVTQGFYFGEKPVLERWGYQGWVDHFKCYISPDHFLPGSPHRTHSPFPDLRGQGKTASNKAAGLHFGGWGRQGQPGRQQGKNRRRFAIGRELSDARRHLFRRKRAQFPVKLFNPEPLLVARKVHG
jgi:hypothetical protein